MKRLKIVIILTLLLCGIKVAGRTIITGYVTDAKTNIPIPGVTIQVTDTNHGTITNKEGFYSLTIQKKGMLKFSILSYKTVYKSVASEKKDIKLNISLEDDNYQLKEVRVVAKSKEQQKRELPNSVTVVNMKKLEDRSLSFADILNQATGVKVLQKGALGSSARMFVQGLDGKSVSIFVNGMPMGSSDEFQIGSIYPEMIKDIEIYKGVVPAYLGGDGLSGAINIITKDFVRNHLEVSYEIASLNTHRVNAMGKKFFRNSGICIDANLNYDYSDNNYKFNSPYVSVPEYITCENNAYKHFNANMCISFAKQWFDIISFSFGYDYRYKEVQGGMAVIQSKIGDTHVKDKSYTSTQVFSKKFLDAKLKIDFNSMIEYNLENLVDTSSIRYNWDGTTENRSIPGEWGSFPNNSDDKYFTLRELLNVNYNINNVHSLNWNTFYKYNKKDPEDDLNDQYSVYSATMYPSSLQVLVTGLTYGVSLFDSKMKNELSGKYFYHYSEVLPMNEGVINNKLKTKSNNSSTFGWSDAMAWHPFNDVTLKASVSQSIRIPVSNEIFGDGIMITPAPNIAPEKSFNINLGAGWIINKWGSPNLRIDVNAFYMRVKDMIRLFSTASMKMSYINLDEAKIMGIEGELESEFTSWISAKLNFTYQDSRDCNKEAVGGGPNWHYDYRIPNMPYCFSNAEIDLHKEDLFCRKSFSSFFIDTEYTHEFSYSWEANKSNTLIIPERWNMNIGVRQSFNRHYNLSFEIHNLLDKEQWSEFRYPLPGRTLHFKLRYTL